MTWTDRFALQRRTRLRRALLAALADAGRAALVLVIVAVAIVLPLLLDGLGVVLSLALIACAMLIVVWRIHYDQISDEEGDGQ